MNQSGPTTIGARQRRRVRSSKTRRRGTYDILDNSGIAVGASPLSYIKNVGLLEKTAGTGTSVIAPVVTNTRNNRGHGGDARLSGGGHRDGIGRNLRGFDAGSSTRRSLLGRRFHSLGSGGNAGPHRPGEEAFSRA